MYFDDVFLPLTVGDTVPEELDFDVYHNDEEKKILPIKGASGLSPERTALIKQNAEDWAKSIWRDMLA